MGEASPISTRYIPPLDGLRGIAILLVIACHYLSFAPAFAFGECGVDLFFVLSGYLITGRLYQTVGQPAYFRTFYRNRILRIFPLYFGTLTAFFFGSRFLRESTQLHLAYYYAHMKSFFVFTENWTFIRYGSPAAPYLLHFWSLAIEEQFYIVWPFLIYCLRGFQSRKKILASAIGLVLLVRCMYVLSHSHEGDLTYYYFNTFFRMDSLLFGALLFQLHYEKIILPARTTDILTTIAALCILTIFLGPFPWLALNSFGFTIVAAASAGLIHRVVAYPRSYLAMCFSRPILRWLGRVSFGLYVFHFPVLQIFQPRFYNSFVRLGSNNLLATIFALSLCLMITFTLTLLSYFFFESFFIRLKNTTAAHGYIKDPTS